MAHPLSRFGEYFYLQSKARRETRLQAGGQDLTVIPQYIALVLGIMVQPFLEHFRATGEWTFDWATLLKWGLFALIAGLIIFPSAYRRAFDVGQPKFVQFCVIFVAGIGWQALFATATHALK